LLAFISSLHKDPCPSQPSAAWYPSSSCQGSGLARMALWEAKVGS
jgi:hypothetical protein